MRRRVTSIGNWLGISLFCTLLLSACGFPGMTSTTQQLPRVSQNTPQSQLPPLHLPQDEGAHSDLNEWWYYTGHLSGIDAAGKVHEYGYELVIFQALRSTLPPIYAAHFAISDITRGEFHYSQLHQTEANAPIPNGTTSNGIDEHVGNWSIRGLNGHDHLVASMQDYAIDLDTVGQKPATLHNGNGLITYGLGGFSYYYSRTRMTLMGTLIDHQQSLRVTGITWMDHQWGNFLALGGGGWDWYSLQLNDDTEIMLYVVRDASGKITSTYAGYIDAANNDHLIPADALSSTVLDHWSSPTTGITYPSGWRLAFNTPELHATLTLTPQLKNQELVAYQTTGNVYWEGAVTIQGQTNGKVMRGEGYVELTGYTK